jgi:hypothetical protein
VGSLLSQTSVYDPHYQDLYSNATSPLKARLYVLFFLTFSGNCCAEAKAYETDRPRNFRRKKQ